mmetsp:Transcript_15767/g.29928  ORF Transcript_15767/g.29928 Transcript_15767/m.29928 type:complete len:757 (-) Transcript_15767:1300-3570(-)
MLFVLRRPAYISIFIVFVARLYLAIGYTFTSPASTSAAVRSRVITPSAFGIRASLFSTACSDISTWGRWPRRRQVVDRSKSRLSSSFYDDFEDFGEIGATSSENSNPADKGKAEDAPLDSGKNGNSLSNSDDDDVLRSLRARLNDLSTQKDEEDDYDEDEDDDDADDIDDTESESALPDLGGNSISSIDDLIGFAQAKASEERQDGKKEWARPIPVEDEESGKVLDFNELLDGGVVLVANPAKFCEDLEDVGLKGEESGEGRFNIGSLLDPFPVSKSSQSSRNGVSPELLAKFGLTIPPPADLGPDRRADLMPVLLITGKDSKGYRAVILNRRTGYLIGDMERQDAIQMDDDDDDDDESSFNEFANEMESRMAKAGFASSKPQSEYSTAKAANPVAVEHNPEEYQFGADPGTTTHMYDLLLDAMACIVHEQYSGSMTSKSSTSSSEDIMEIMGEDIPPPPAMAKSILQKVLHRHWLDGGDIGFGVAGDDGNDFFKPAQGVGTGAGTGAGNLAKITQRTSFDVRTCPTPMTFNAVLRVAAEFDPAAHASAVENAQILRGNKGKRNGLLDIQQEQERLRDITLDAAFSTYSQMKTCAALTLRSISKSSLNATSRSALKRQAKLLAPGSNADHKSKFNAITSGRNSATYAYMLRTISNCIPPSLSRGNIAFGLYHKACVQEGVMDEILVKAMRNVGGYEDNDDVAENTFSPPVVNGPLFDSFMEKELRFGWTAALDKGRKLRQDRNYKLRRFVEWDDTY